MKIYIFGRFHGKTSFLYTQATIWLIMQFVFLFLFLHLFAGIIHGQENNPLLSHIVPLASCSPNDSMLQDEQRQLSALFKKSRIIALGEATHGTHEIFTMKHRLIKFLVESKGFKLIGLEAGMPETEAINRYILSGEGSAQTAVRQLGMWSVGNYDVLNLVQWLYRFNQQQTKKNKVRICGFDVQMTDSAVHIVMRFFQRVNPHYTATFLQQEQCYGWLTTTPTLPAMSNWKKMSDSAQLQHIMCADSIVRHLDFFQKKYTQATSSVEFAWARRNAWLISCAVRIFNSTKSRDSSMAENVSWLMKFYKEKNIVLWAHNGHIWCENHTASRSNATMGWYLRKKYLQDYFAVAITANTGTYSAVREGALRRDNEIILDSNTNHLENYLHRTKIQQGFINLRSIQPTDFSYEWFSRLQAMRFIGSVVLPAQFGYTYLLKNFDGLIFIDSTTAVIPLPSNTYYR
jgi:erythromycin esterase